MCGIVGCLRPSPDARVDPAMIGRMADSIAHRGPDGRGVWTSGPIGLGHRRLAIIDPAGGAQPMGSPDDSLQLVFNGAIYNHVELRRDLSSRGATFRTNSDTEVILHAYEAYDDDCVQHFNGMFAFALWDERRRRLLVARDRLGVKPLYWTSTPHGLFFASEVKALLASCRVAANCDGDALGEYFTYQFVTGRRSLFAGIHRLEPGHLLTISPDGAAKPEIKRYWTLSGEIDTHHTFDYFKDRLLELLGDSVRLQLRSDVPLGAYLSGGADSSIVTCLAAARSDSPLSVFCGAFDEGPEFDESPYARLVAERAGAVYHEVRPTANDFIELMPRLIRLMDEPMAGPGLFPQYCVSRLAAQSVKVCLGGQGGDELFGGYARYLIAYLEQCLKGAIQGTSQDGNYVVTWDTIAPQLPMLKTYLPLLQDFLASGLFDDMDRRYFKLIARDEGLSGVLSGDVWNASRKAAVFERFRQQFKSAPAQSYIARMTHFDMTTLLPALLHVEDRVSMGVGLESRVPMLDHRIVELVQTMPPVMRFAGGRSKHVLREAVGDLVPPAVLARQDKMGFPVPLAKWASGPVREFFCDVLLSRRARHRGLFRSQEIERQITKTGKFSRLLWGLLCIELWHREFIDAPVAQPDSRQMSALTLDSEASAFKSEISNLRLMAEELSRAASLIVEPSVDDELIPASRALEHDLHLDHENRIASLVAGHIGTP